MYMKYAGSIKRDNMWLLIKTNLKGQSESKFLYPEITVLAKVSYVSAM